MKAVLRPSLALGALLVLAACAGTEETADVVMEIDLTTSSEEARAEFLAGQQALDMGRPISEVREHFNRAVELDPDFAMAYMNLANSANSAEEFAAYLSEAAARSSEATEAEQLMIRIAELGLDNDADGQLEAAQRLVEIEPESPRAWLTLAGIQTGLNDHEAARASMMRASELAPEFAPAYMQLGNSYLFNDPKDFSKTEEYMSMVVELEPDEPLSHDLMGDAHRALSQMEEARQSYTRAHELDPDNALPLQQRGHVNSFLGNYEQARADYDSAIVRAEGNNKAAFAVYRAYVNIYEGDPQAAIAELNQLVEDIDGMDIPGAVGQKIFALTSVANIAMHERILDEAESAVERLGPLFEAQAEQINNEAFKRGQQAAHLFWEGMLAAVGGDLSTAREKAQARMSLLENDANPRRNEASHNILGMASLFEQDYQAAIDHFEQSNSANVYMLYHKALAHEGAGEDAAAQEIYDYLTDYNFNSVGYALIREDVIEKASS